MQVKNDRFLLRSAVYLILFDDENRILMSRRHNTGFEDGNYSLVAGHLDGNETIKEALLREAKEEINIALKENDLELVHTSHRKTDFLEYIDFYFIAKNWYGDLRINEKDKCDDLKWFLINELPSNTVSYIVKILKFIENNISFSELGFSNNKNENAIDNF